MYLAIRNGLYKGIYEGKQYSDIKELFQKMYKYPEFKIYNDSEKQEAMLWVGKDRVLSKISHINPSEKSKNFLEIIERITEDGTHMTVAFLDGSNTTFFTKDVCLINTRKLIQYSDIEFKNYRILAYDDFISPNSFFVCMNEYIDKKYPRLPRKEAIRKYLYLYKENFGEYPWYTYEASTIYVWGDFILVNSFGSLKTTKTLLLEKQDIIGNKIFNVNAIKDIHIFGIGVIAKDNDFLEVVQETDRKVF